jgi:hypothetical protein
MLDTKGSKHDSNINISREIKRKNYRSRKKIDRSNKKAGGSRTQEEKKPLACLISLCQEQPGNKSKG